ncbi:hypothetical protein ACIBFB_22365 [Nocardiopsis sp. NPDC050513]|uniref:hypothetical protein n=1 Tax=Nocardiopsis sp. NPDC050513 TaxID=3364338 RepID=UPI0037AFF226
MQHTVGRHRRPHRTVAGRLRSVLAAVLAQALAFVFLPDPPRRAPVATAPPPDPPRPPVPPAATGESTAWDTGDPDEVGGALVRPYLSRSPVPRPRLPEGDLLARSPGGPTGDLGDLAAAVRAYLDTVG